jgi:tRNA(Ile)-lysidine synthetase-like protein
MITRIVRQFFVNAGVADRGIVAAVSGGADSTALLLALAELPAPTVAVVAAHVNHHLRGADSDADEAFLRELCLRLEIPLHVADGTLDPERIRARGIEAAAREVRYALLAEIRDAVGARFVATAHQKNDQAETVLMRLVTGSGLAALRGIHPIRADGFIRPLLDVTREEIDAFLRERGVTPRHDRSNDDPRFLRNRIRQVVRQLEAVDALAAVAAQARQQWPVLERAIDEAERMHVEVHPDATLFRTWPEDAWLRQALLHRHIHRLDPAARDVSARDLERLAADLERMKRVSVTKTLELVRREGVVLLRRRPKPIGAFEVELTPDAPACIAELGVTVHVRELAAVDVLARAAPLPSPLPPPGERGLTPRSARSTSPLSPHEAGRGLGRGAALATHSADITLPPGSPARFLVRNRRPGDRFGSKKLKEVLIDRKIDREVRDRLLLLVWNDEVVWIAGVVISERFGTAASSGGDRYRVWLEGSGAADDDRDPARVQR